MSSVVSSTWAGRPSRIATREGPWDSPAVSQRSMGSVFHAGGLGRRSPSGCEIPGHVGAPHDADHGADQHERPEGEVAVLGDPQQAEWDPADRSDEETGVD